MNTSERVDALEERVAELERKLLLPRIAPMTPAGPSFTPPYTTLPTPYLTGDKCSKCRISLTGVMGYVCPRSDCPTGLCGPQC